MKNPIKIILRTFAILSIITLVMINFQIENPSHISWDNITITAGVNEAMAQDEEGLEMREETCWETGEKINICRYADATCDVSAQDPCGDDDPGEN